MNTSYLKANFKIAIKSKKNILLFLALILLSCSLLFVVEHQHLGASANSWESYHESVSRNIKYFQNNQLKGKKYTATYNNLNQQSALLADIENSAVFKSSKSYFSAATKLINVMLQGYKNNYAGASSLAIMTKVELYQLRATYRYLAKHNISIALSSTKSSTYLIYLLTFLGTIIYFFIVLITCDTWMPILQHPTLLKNTPYSLKNKIISTNLINLFIIVSSVLISIIGAFLIAGIKNGFSNINYPISFYIKQFSAIAIWKYVLLFVLYISVVCIFGTNLSILLNFLTNNIYLTIFISCSTYFFAYIPAKFIYFLPSPYLNITRLFNGSLSVNANLSFPLNLLTGIFILLIWSIILAALFIFFNRKEGKQK